MSLENESITTEKLRDLWGMSIKNATLAGIYKGLLEGFIAQHIAKIDYYSVDSKVYDKVVKALSDVEVK